MRAEMIRRIEGALQELEETFIGMNPLLIRALQKSRLFEL
jgi:hypothetical protein